MLNSGESLNLFTTPKKRLSSEASSYIPEISCEVSKDLSVENLNLSENIQEINIENIKTLSITCPNKYLIEVIARITS